MSGEATVVVGLALGMIAMVGVGLLERRWALARARSAERLELLVPSTVRTLVVVLVALPAVPVAMGVVAELTDPWARSHAAALVLVGAFGGMATLFGALRATRRLCAVGRLVCDGGALELELDGQRVRVDLGRPFELGEGVASTEDVQMQIVSVRQDSEVITFTYGLPVWMAPYPAPPFEGPPGPTLGVEGRAVHDRLRAIAGVG